jgi:hypothetical protein
MELKVYVITESCKAALALDMKECPVYPKIRPNATKAGLNHIKRTVDKYQSDFKKFQLRTKVFDVIGFRKDCGIVSLVSIIGMEVEAEEANNCIYIHRLVSKK